MTLSMRWAIPALFIGSIVGAQGSATPVAAGSGAGAEKVYFDFQVEVPVRGDSTNRAPTYPPAMRAAHISADEMVQFVVDTLGRADTTAFQIVKTYGPLFAASVKTAVAGYHFSPAMLGGRKVRQLVMMPFHFRITP